MGQILFVNSCVRNESRTYELARRYLDTLTGDDAAPGEETKIIERDITVLGLCPMDEARLAKREQAIAVSDYSAPDFKLAIEFADADLIVIAAPYWDCSFPSFLKLYFEHIMIRDITIGFTPKGRMLKLCQADKLVYISTSGGYIRKNSGVQIQIEELCALFGIGEVQFYCAQALDMFPDKVMHILDKTFDEMVLGENTAIRSRIPDRKIPEITEYRIANIDEPLVSLKERGFVISSQYYLQGMSGAAKDCYVRKTAADMLEKAREYLPKGYNFKVFDGYRPIKIQQELWDYFRSDIANSNPELSSEEIDRRTTLFVSKPSYDEQNPSLHNTGGAVDLSIVDDEGEDLDMGTDFDSFKTTSFTNFYEKDNSNLQARDNRRLLYHVMTQSGFTNLPSEWWHFDYGTKFWAYYKKTDALYRGILTIKLPDTLS